MGRTVATAKGTIEYIERVCEEMAEFDEKCGADEDTGFLCDVAMLLGDYRKILESEIDNAELRI